MTQLAHKLAPRFGRGPKIMRKYPQVPAPDSGANPDANKPARRAGYPPIEPRIHVDFGREIPFHDEELDVLEGAEHYNAVRYLSEALDQVAKQYGLGRFSDHPVWYIDPDTDDQRLYAPDTVLAGVTSPARVTAHDLYVVFEIVSTGDSRKEHKDRERMPRVNAHNGVPEFVLIYPGMDDDRIIELFSLNAKTGAYVRARPYRGALRSRVIPDLAFRPLPRSEWKDGKKLEILFQGQAFPDYPELLARERALEAEIRRLKKKLK